MWFVLLGILAFLFLSSVDGKCVPFYRLSNLSNIAESYQLNKKKKLNLLLGAFGR